MSFAVMHISSFKCCLSKTIDFKISRNTQRITHSISHTHTRTHTDAISLYFQPCKYIAFYTGVWGAVVLLADKKSCVIIEVKGCFFLSRSMDRL